MKSRLNSHLLLEHRNIHTKLYRYTKENYLIKKNEYLFIKAKEHPIEIIDDHVNTRELINAYKVDRGLGFCSTPHNYHKSDDKVCVSIEIKTILEQGGMIYKELSSSTPDAWFVTLPEGEIEVELV